jgi:GT2 family glycosyltransferase
LRSPAGITNPHPENVNAEVAEMILEVLLGHYRPEPGGDYFFRSMNLAVGADELRAAGGFDPAFGTAEDRELCDRWLQRGGSLVRVPAALVAHSSELTFRLFVVRHFRYGRGAYRFHRLRRERGSGRLHPGVLGFYAAVFARCFGPPLRRIGPRVALAATWQLSNAAGFLTELVRSATTPR